MVRTLMATVSLLLSTSVVQMPEPVARDWEAERREYEARVSKAVDDCVWALMCRALISVESGGNPNAVNPDSGATGIYQIMKSYVDFVNSIQSAERFTYDDRKDPEKSQRMFDYWQGYFNPERDVILAINIHLKGPAGHRKNPNKHQWYVKRVIRAITEIAEEIEEGYQADACGAICGDAELRDINLGVERRLQELRHHVEDSRPLGDERPGETLDEVSPPGEPSIHEGVPIPAPTDGSRYPSATAIAD